MFDPGSTLRFAELNPEFSPLWLPDVVRLALAVGEPAVARAATEACTAAAEQQRLPLVAACARHCRGLLTADPTQLHTVADAFAEVGYPFFGAQALENAAVVHAERGDASAARTAYGRAVDTYTELGAAWGLMRADARLRPLGIRRGVRGARRRPSTGWEALTPAESKIVQLVAAGQSNPDIAAALFLSRATVQTHVSHILAKLGAHSRIESPARLPPRHDHRDPLDWTTRPLSIDMLRRQTACGDANAAATSGLVAYLDDAPVAWVAVEPRTAYPKLRTSRVPWSGRQEDKDDDDIWAVTCLVVRKGVGLSTPPEQDRTDGQRTRHGPTAERACSAPMAALQLSQPTPSPSRSNS